MTRRSIGLTLALAAGAALVGVSTGGDAPVVDAAPRAQRVLLVSDSVGLGTRGSFDDAFPGDWEANVIGTPALFVEQLESKHVRPTLAGAPHLVGDHVVIGGGYNYPYWDQARFDRSIDSMVDTLTAAGVKHVYWVTLREVKPQFISAKAWRQVQPYYWYFPEVNERLEAALARHSNLTLVDWAAAADRPGITYDAIHLNRDGAALYSNLIANAVAVNERRPIDGTITKVDVTDEAGASAVALNLAATRTRHTGYFTAFDCAGTPPEVANVNFVRGDTVSSAAIVPVDADGNVCVFNSTASDVIVDVSGVFGADAGRESGAPFRVYDSRDAGVPESPGVGRTIAIGSADDAAVALNVTAIKPAGTGYITVHDCEVAPSTATVNVEPGDIRPNLVLVKPDADGNVCVTSTGTSTHLTVDRFAVFADPDAIDIIEPERVFDSRGGDAPGAGATRRFALSDTTIDVSDGNDPVTAVFVNLAVINAQNNGYATVWPCDEPRPTTANANFFIGDTISNFVTVAPDDAGEICVWTSAAANVAIDVLGAARNGFVGFTPVRKLDTRQ